jgi:D-alanyl-lipoteichoic acid acyltransferase DltB (MBOAT superfamily)
MGLGLETILVFVVFALLYAGLARGRWRNWLLFAASVVAVYWLQPWLPLRYADFLLPTLTLTLTAGGWWLTRKPDEGGRWRLDRGDWWALALLLGLILLMGMNRFLAPDWRLTASRPPAPGLILVVLAVTGVVLAAVTPLLAGPRRWWTLTGGILFIVGIFIVLKTPALNHAAAAWWRSQTGQDPTLASPLDLRWLGFSYVSFRIIHTLRDRQSGLLPDLGLQEYVAYVIFFPAFIAGPIDRAERFQKDWRALPGLRGLDAARLSEGGIRILTGMFKKFVIADTLALGMSLTPDLAVQSHSTLGLWALLYGYALRLYFDFAGYTDIAIGVGLLLGIRLPENFKRPYLKTNITTFWQSWHITLSDWARFYIFSPLSRSLLRRKPRPSTTLIVFLSLMATMLTIGLWHGIAWTFVLWGAWHGLGLFIHKKWSDRTRKWYRELGNHPRKKQAWTLFAWFITFQFVVLGWVWFLLPDSTLATRTFLRLFGIGW